MVACIWTLVDISFNLLMKATTLNCIVWYQCDLDLHSRSPLFGSNLGSKSEQSHIECGAWFGICMLWCSFLDPIFCVCSFDLCIRCMCKAGGEDEPWLFHLHQRSLDYFYLLDSCSLLCFSKMQYGSVKKNLIPEIGRSAIAQTQFTYKLWSCASFSFYDSRARLCSKYTPALIISFGFKNYVSTNNKNFAKFSRGS